MSFASALFFWVLAAVVGGSAVMVVVTQNIVRCAVWLLFTLAGTSILYFHLGADFVGATQLIVYVGGTLVLVVFGVMLTAQGPFISMKTPAAEWAIGLVAGFIFFGVLIAGIAGEKAPVSKLEDVKPENSPTTQTLGYAFLGMPEATKEADLTGFPPDTAAPKRERMAYLLPFEIISVHLLVVLIGAAYLARAKRRAGRASEEGHA